MSTITDVKSLFWRTVYQRFERIRCQLHLYGHISGHRKHGDDVNISELCMRIFSRSQWLLGSAASHLLGLRVRIPPRAWMSVFCKCGVMSGTGLSVGLTTQPEKSYHESCV